MFEVTQDEFDKVQRMASIGSGSTRGKITPPNLESDTRAATQPTPTTIGGGNGAGTETPSSSDGSESDSVPDSIDQQLLINALQSAAMVMRLTEAGATFVPLSSPSNGGGTVKPLSES